MRIRRKTKDCLNCGLGLDEIYNFCPRCGQENTHRMVSVRELIGDFFVNYFSFDTKFFRSAKPFIFHPGRLTQLFAEGKRASYVNPLRLYIIVSVFFFFLSTIYVKESTIEAKIATQERLDLIPLPADSVVNDTLPAKDENRTTFNDVLSDESLDNREALDSLRSMYDIEINMDTTSYLASLVFNQLRKVVRQDIEVFTVYIVQNMPVMMFLLLPVYAILLKLLYIRHDILYVKHLIHGLHLHAFAFFLLSLLLLVYLFFDSLIMMSSWAGLFVFISLTVYVYTSLFNVYQQSWVKTFVKFALLGVSYFLVLAFFGLSEAFISFLVF